MFTWVVVTSAGLGAALFESVSSVANLLDGDYCVGIPDDVTSANLVECHKYLQLAMLPWLVFLPLFALSTSLLRDRLAGSLHDAWYTPGQPVRDFRTAEEREEPLPEIQPPTVMFRITATYYSRTWDDAEVEGTLLSVGPLARMASGGQSVLNSTFRQSAASIRGPGRSVDHASSLLSARGSTWDELVQSEQLCFICYDRPPETVLLECGHAGLCRTCALQLLTRRARCPVCRSRISNVVRIVTDRPIPSDMFAGQGAGLGLEGPPWPAAAKRNAVAVEVVRRVQRNDGGRDSNAWWGR